MDWNDEDLDAAPAVISADWEGEDVEELGSWEDQMKETPEKVEIKKKEDKIQKRKAKELLEAKKREEEQERLKQVEKSMESEYRRQQLSQRAELEHLQDAFAIADVSDKSSELDSGSSFEGLKPVKLADFTMLAVLVKKKLVQHESSPHYFSCLNAIFRGVVENQDIEVIRRLSANLNALANEKQRADKLKLKKKGNKKNALKIANKVDEIFEEGEEPMAQNGDTDEESYL